MCLVQMDLGYLEGTGYKTDQNRGKALLVEAEKAITKNWQKAEGPTQTNNGQTYLQTQNGGTTIFEGL